MAIAIVARIKAKPGCEKQLEEGFRAMIAKVRSEEPGALQYILHRSVKDPTQYVFYEVYQDQAAVDFHGKTPHMREMGAKIRDLVESTTLDIVTEVDRK